MTNQNDLRDILRNLVQSIPVKPKFIRGLLGDGLGNVQVPGKPDRSFVRFNRGADVFSEVFNVKVPLVNDYPVMVGELPEQPGLIQVVDADWATYEQSGWGDSIGATSPHAPTHEWPDGLPGSDIVNVHMRAIVPLKGYVIGTGSTTFFANSYDYQSAGTGTTFTGLPGLEFSSLMSSMVTGTARLIGVFLDPTTNVLDAVTGTVDVFTDAFDPPRPNFPASIFPVSWVRVYGGQAGLLEQDIRDARRLFEASEGTTRDRELCFTSLLLDEEICIFLEDSATGTISSDLIIKLADAAGNSKLIIRDSADANVGAWQSDGFLGVGTTEPFRVFHVVGPDGIVPGFPSGVGAKDLMIFENNNNSNFGFVSGVNRTASIKMYESGSSDFLGILSYNHATDVFSMSVTVVTDGINIDINNNVGIGVTTPAQLLELENNDAALTAIQISNTSTGNEAILFAPDGVVTWAIWRDDDDSDKIKIGPTVEGSVFFTIDTSGNVGIGTTSPSSLLQLSAAVTPTLRLTDTTSNIEAVLAAGNNNASLALGNSTPVTWSIISDNSPAGLRYNNGSNRVFFADGGNVGIATTVPGGLLGLSDANTFLDVDGSNNLTFTDTVAGTKTLAQLAGAAPVTEDANKVFLFVNFT